ncbi:hypothetical protein L195_g061272, partial [Trifolium pratense]
AVGGDGGDVGFELGWFKGGKGEAGRTGELGVEGGETWVGKVTGGLLGVSVWVLDIMWFMM